MQSKYDEYCERKYKAGEAFKDPLEWKEASEKWAAALKETPPKKVTVKVDIIYSGNDMRPDKIIVNYTIDGKADFQVIKN
ncbi:DNA/RNA non-specific endonuclease [Bacillus sp. JJ927]|uniref:DNA/RNA non-specific endonuclease n=1 Tax=Bacillus sp. JJ927 TaxID=3122976 RepID=UPI0033998656